MSIDHRSPPFKAGDEVCRVKLQRLIGKGGQGFVYEGIHQFLKKPVAVKAIPNAPDSTRNLRQRAEREAGILFDLQHPNVLRVTDADVTDDGVVCIVMEMLKGRSIRSLLHELHRVRVDEALLIGAQIADGVQAAHERQTIHRDLKPENVYIEPGNIVKVLDFGIAKILGPGAVTTQENLIQGTLQYMSPEHLQARPVTARSDVFALGCILYELLSGSTPSVIGLEGVTVQLAGWNQIMLIPPRLDTVVDHVPASVARAIQLMLAKEPDERPASMKAVSQELRALSAKYAMATPCPLRELWHEGAGAAPPVVLAKKPAMAAAKPAMATTTVPDTAGPDNQAAPQPSASSNESSRIVQTARSQAITRPMPLLVRSDSKPQQPTVVLRDDTPTSTNPLMRSSDAVADAPPTESALVTPPPSYGPTRAAVPDLAQAQASVPSFRLRWSSVSLAAGLGVIIGLVALFASSLASHDEAASAASSASASASTAALPTLSAIPAATVPSSLPVPVDAVTEAPASTSALASPVSNPAPAPQTALGRTLPAASALPAARALAAASPRATTSTKPTVRTPKKAVPKDLPFTGDDLTF